MVVIREREFTECPTCHVRQLVKVEAYGCDECGRQINLYDGERDYLRIALHRYEAAAEWLHYCSWRCVFAALPKLKTDDFINLPYLDYSISGPTGAKAFFSEMKRRRP